LFGLCALSQFSAHGVSTSSARMSTSWKLVLLALDHTRLVADPQVDNGLSSRSLRRRDAYIRLIVSRCLILHQRWSWRLDLDDDASAVLLRRLVEISRVASSPTCGVRLPDSPDSFRRTTQAPWWCPLL
jgi:Mus7/MMS22 family